MANHDVKVRWLLGPSPSRSVTSSATQPIQTPHVCCYAGPFVGSASVHTCCLERLATAELLKLLWKSWTRYSGLKCINMQTIRAGDYLCTEHGKEADNFFCISGSIRSKPDLTMRFVSPAITSTSDHHGWFSTTQNVQANT